MKTKINLLIVLMLVFAAFGQHTTVYAGGAQVFRLKGPTAIAPFISASGCIYTETAVMASVPRIRVEPGPAEPLSFAAVSIFQYDTCTDTLLYSAYGDTAPLSSEEFQISSTLDSATLNTTINVFDEASSTAFNVDVDVTWLSTGPVMRQHGNEHFHTPGCLVNGHYQTTS